MKKIFAFSIISLLIGFSANGATTPWWLQPTICRLDPTNCYPTMGAGFDSEMWDATSNCRGLKIICADALKTGTDDTAMGLAEIARGAGILVDYDTDLLGTSGNCFGRRKTAENGSMASVNGKYVNVWCSGILDNPDEFLPNGEITYGTQPTCDELAEYGFAAVENGRCYGKYYNPSQYYIDCIGGNGNLPYRIITLNGADYSTDKNDAPTTMDDANEVFDTMFATSQKQKEKYFQE